MATATALNFPKKPRSHVWQYFKWLPSADGRPLCMCKLCKKVYRFSRDCTSNLARHLRCQHGISPVHSTRSKSSTIVPNSPTFKYRANEMPDNSPDTLILECTDLEETLEKDVSVTQFFEKTDVSMAGSSACILCSCVFGPAEQNPDNLLAHLNMKHENDVPSDLWPLLKASAEKDSGQESSKAATQVEASTPAIRKRHCNKANHPSVSSRGIYKPRSLVWRFFDRPVDDSSAVRCRLCKKTMSRGQLGSTTKYLKHLYMLHADNLIAVGLDPAALQVKISSAADKFQSKLRDENKGLHDSAPVMSSPRQTNNASKPSDPDEENHGAINDETVDDEELDRLNHFPEENNSISAVERLWSRHCAEQEKDYQAELLALDLQAAEFQGRLSELQRMLAGVKERRREAEARRRKELLRQHQLKKQFVLATAAPKNQDPICDTQGGEAMQKRKTRNDSMIDDVIKRHRKRLASLTSGRLPGHTQRRPTDASLLTGRSSGHTQRADANGTRNGCGTGRDMAVATDSSDETDNVKLCELTGQIV